VTPDIDPLGQELGHNASSSSLHSLLIDQAMAFERMGDLQKAEYIYRGLVDERADDADLLLRLGFVVHRSGRPLEALTWMARAAAARPEAAKPLGILGTALAKLGRHGAAAAAFLRCAILAPAEADPYLALGNAFQDLGEGDKAAGAYHRLVRLAPALAEGCFQLGNAAFTQQRNQEAAAAYRHAVSLEPHLSKAYANLGTSLYRLDRIGDSIAAGRRAALLSPNDPKASTALGDTLLAQGQFESAIRSYHATIVLDPACAEAHYCLGAALHQRERQHAAYQMTFAPMLSYRRALSLAPDHWKALNTLGVWFADRRQGTEAARCYRYSLAHAPSHADAYCNLGNALRTTDCPDKAIDSYRRALVLDKRQAKAHNNLGTALHEQGDLSGAIEILRQAIALDPDYAEAHSNLLMILHYAQGISNRDLQNEARRYARQFDREDTQAIFPNGPQPERRLRIGYVSADFGNHPVGYFLLDVLSAHDPAAVEVFGYCNRAVVDAMTARLRSAAHHWRDIVNLPDAQVETQIRRDSIDILVDLSGHTAKNRLPLFALRPAPIQVSWLGYFGTTGLGAMDYILADRFVLPEDDKRYFSEAVRYLPNSYLCFSTPDLDLRVSPLPAALSGSVTFGCFNNWAKVTPDTIAVWSAILARVAGSRLLLKTRALGDARIRQSVSEAFAAHGIATERLVMEGAAPRAELLAAYNRVDIALDPFPFGGGTTTVESLWMGVPVVTLRGDRWVGRVSESILSTTGVRELVAASPTDYADIAIALAGDHPRLARLRTTLRKQFETSPLHDAATFTRQLEHAYRQMWRSWCTRQQKRTQTS
jgi:protein O-GlcNAc transferase